MVKIAPSLLAADFSRLGEAVRKAEEGGANYLHLDIMDGHFVPNISFGPAVVAALRPASRLTFDVHLMISDPDRYIPAFVEAGADLISVHVEACPHLHRTIQSIREHGVRAAVALNPATPLNGIEYILDQVDLVLLMTVNPGFGGQAYLPFVDEKIRRLNRWLTERELEVEVEVDGGITSATAPAAVAAGANVLVAGSAIFAAKDVAQAIKEIKDSVNFSIS